MSIQDILATRNSRYASATDPTTVLLIALADIQEELRRLHLNITAPTIDLSSLESAIRDLHTGFPGPVPPQDLDLNPVLRSYEDTANLLKELLGEVRTTNHRISGFRSGGGPDNSPLLTDIKRHISDADVRLDYSSRTDTNPVYIGRAPSSTPTTSNWSIQYLTYDASSRVTFVQHQTGAWDSRATLPWS